MIQYKQTKLKYPSYSTLIFILEIPSNLIRRNCLPLKHSLMHRMNDYKKLPPINKANSDKVVHKPLNTLNRSLRRNISTMKRYKTIADRFELELPGNDNYEGMVELIEDIKKLVNHSSDNEMTILDTTGTETPSRLHETGPIIRRPSVILRKRKVRIPIKKTESEKLGEY